MAKYISGKFKNLQVGIKSYSANRSSLKIIGSATFNGITTVSSSGIIVGGAGIVTASQISLASGGGIGNVGITTTELTVGTSVTITASDGKITANTFRGGNFIGDGSGLTDVIGSGSGVIVRDDGSLVGTAGTIDFGSNLAVSPIVAGVVTITNPTDAYWAKTDVGIHTISNVGIGTTNPTVALVVGGKAEFSSDISLTQSSRLQGGEGYLFIYADKDAGNPLVVRESGVGIADSIYHLSNDNTQIRFPRNDEFSVETAGSVRIHIRQNGNIGIGTTNAQGTVQVGTGLTFQEDSGNITLTGIVTAKKYYGDGSSLTNIVASGSGIQVRDSNSIIGAAGTINFGDNLSVTDITDSVATVVGTSTENVITNNINVVGTSTVTGISTFGDGVFVAGGLDVVGASTITGIGTFGNDVFVAGDLNI